MIQARLRHRIAPPIIGEEGPYERLGIRAGGSSGTAFGCLSDTPAASRWTKQSVTRADLTDRREPPSPSALPWRNETGIQERAYD
jgi:hypothetical protein